jgi:hypothetical protein
MKKKTTKKKTTTGARKAKVHDLSARKRAAAAAKGGASVVSSASGVSGIVAAKNNLQLDSCWLEGPARREGERSLSEAPNCSSKSRDGEFGLSPTSDALPPAVLGTSGVVRDRRWRGPWRRRRRPSRDW